MIPNKFIAKPSETNLLAGNAPVEKITIFGGVATGSMKAQEALMAAGIISSFGSMLAPIAAAANIGINRVVVAVLLVTSVKNVTERQITKTMTSTGNNARSSSADPIMELSPELTKAWAIDKPAPKSIKVPQGIRLADSQSSNFPPRLSGTINISTIARNATIASLAYLKSSISVQPPQGPFRVTHNNTVTAKINNTRFSAADQTPVSGKSRFPE